MHAHLSEGSQNANAKRLEDFCDWLGKIPKQLTKEFEDSEDRDKYVKQLGFKVEEWMQKLERDGYKVNTYRVMPNGIRGFAKRCMHTFLIGLVLAILASSLISTVVSIQWANPRF